MISGRAFITVLIDPLDSPKEKGLQSLNVTINPQTIKTQMEERASAKTEEGRVTCKEILGKEILSTKDFQ